MRWGVVSPGDDGEADDREGGWSTTHVVAGTELGWRLVGHGGDTLTLAFGRSHGNAEKMGN